MEATSRAGRIIGILIIMQMVGSGMVNFVMEGPLSAAPGFLVNASSHSRQIALAVLLGLVTEALWVGIAVTAFPVFWQRSRRMALWLVALAVVSLAVGVVENIGVMSMVSLSEAYAKASAVEREQLQTVRVIVASARDWPHFISRIFVGGAIFVPIAGIISPTNVDAPASILLIAGVALGGRSSLLGPMLGAIAVGYGR